MVPFLPVRNRGRPTDLGLGQQHGGDGGGRRQEAVTSLVVATTTNRGERRSSRPAMEQRHPWPATQGVEHGRIWASSGWGGEVAGRRRGWGAVWRGRSRGRRALVASQRRGASGSGDAWRQEVRGRPGRRGCRRGPGRGPVVRCEEGEASVVRLACWAAEVAGLQELDGWCDGGKQEGVEGEGRWDREVAARGRWGSRR